MLMRAFSMVVVLFAVAGCRTSVQAHPVRPPTDIFNPPEGECHVHDYPESTDVPEGAKGLGRVQVERAASDEETYLALRQAICAKGGDALSSLHWNFELGQRTGEPKELEANAWILP